MAYRSEKEIRESQQLGEFDRLQHGVENLPPGFIEGFRPVLGNDLRVTIDPGIANVQGYRVQKDQYLLRKADFVHGQNGGDQGLTYYVYLSKGGDYSVELIAPVFTQDRFYYQHPINERRAILRLFVNSEDDIIFASRNFTLSSEVLVASKEYSLDADYYSTGVNDNRIINSALEYAKSVGGRVTLTGGEFSISEPIVLDSDTYLSGQVGGATVLNREGRNVVISIPGTSISRKSYIEVRDIKISNLSTDTTASLDEIISANYSDDLAFENVTYIGQDTIYSVPLYVNNCNRVTIRSCNFSGANQQTIVSGVIKINGSSGVSVSGTSISECRRDAISVVASSGISVNRCYFDDIGSAIRVYGSNSSNVEISECSVSSASASAIYIDTDDSESNSRIFGNKIVDADFGIYVGADAVSTVILGNTIYNTVGSGITINGKHAIVSSNSISHASNGIFVNGPASGSLITGNICIGNSGSGIVVQGDYSAISGNTLSGNKYGLYISDVYSEGIATCNIIYNNFDRNTIFNSSYFYTDTETDSDPLNWTPGMGRPVVYEAEEIDVDEDVSVSIGP